MRIRKPTSRQGKSHCIFRRNPFFEHYAEPKELYDTEDCKKAKDDESATEYYQPVTAVRLRSTESQERTYSCC